MILLPEYQKARDIYHECGEVKAWKYWKLLGKTSAIFLGEIPSEDFITGDDLADRVGITKGKSQYSNTEWLKFILDYDLIYVPKKPIRSHISWDRIYSRGAVYGTGDNGLYPTGISTTQDATVEIEGYTYQVRLLKGVNVDQVNLTRSGAGHDVDWTHDSEWNRLMYPIHSGVHMDSSNPSNPSEPYNQWASYSDVDLLVRQSFGNGSYCWTQENHPRATSGRVLRGGYGVSYADRTTSSATTSFRGWRPALVLVK